jgi:hypothetical protein
MADHHDRCATLIDYTLRCTCERERNYDASVSTHGVQIGMTFGADALNDARGWGSYSPEPCGHHCPWNCPSCGEGTVVPRRKATVKVKPVVRCGTGWNFQEEEDLEDYL